MYVASIKNLAVLLGYFHAILLYFRFRQQLNMPREKKPKDSKKVCLIRCVMRVFYAALEFGLAVNLHCRDRLGLVLSPVSKRLDAGTSVVSCYS